MVSYSRAAGNGRSSFGTFYRSSTEEDLSEARTELSGSTFFSRGQSLHIVFVETCSLTAPRHELFEETPKDCTVKGEFEAHGEPAPPLLLSQACYRNSLLRMDEVFRCSSIRPSAVDPRVAVDNRCMETRKMRMLSLAVSLEHTGRAKIISNHKDALQLTVPLK